MPLLVVTLCINAEHLKLLFVSVSFHWEFLRTFHRVLFRIQLSYGLGVSAWYKCWIYLCIIPLIRRKIFWYVDSNLRGWLGCQSEGSRKNVRDWCHNVVWIWIWDVSEEKKVLWHNLKDMDAVRSLLTHTRKIKLWCAVCQQSLIRRRKLPAAVSPQQCQFLAPFFTLGWEQGSFRASSPLRSVPGLPNCWYIYKPCRIAVPLLRQQMLP